MKKFFIPVVFIIFALINLNALRLVDSSSKQRPLWLEETPDGEIFSYYSGFASSKNSLDDAKDLAISDALSEVLMNNEVTVEGIITTRDEQDEEELFSKITKEIKLKGSSTLVKGLDKEEEYWESLLVKTDIIYRYWVLMKIPKTKYQNYHFSPDDLKLSYGFTPIVKSIIVPGWGQIHKKEPKKGVLFLSSFAVMLTTGFVTHNISKSYEQDADNANNSEWINYYNDLSNQYYLASMASFVLSGAIYGYNVFDVISAKGAKIYAFDDSKTLQMGVNYKYSQFRLEVSFNF